MGFENLGEEIEEEFASFLSDDGRLRDKVGYAERSGFGFKDSLDVVRERSRQWRKDNAAYVKSEFFRARAYEILKRWRAENPDAYRANCRRHNAARLARIKKDAVLEAKIREKTRLYQQQYRAKRKKDPARYKAYLEKAARSKRKNPDVTRVVVSRRMVSAWALALGTEFSVHQVITEFKMKFEAACAAASRLCVDGDLIRIRQGRYIHSAVAAKEAA